MSKSTPLSTGASTTFILMGTSTPPHLQYAEYQLFISVRREDGM